MKPNETKPTETMIDANYADDLELLSNTPAHNCIVKRK